MTPDERDAILQVSTALRALGESAAHDFEAGLAKLAQGVELLTRAEALANAVDESPF